VITPVEPSLLKKGKVSAKILKRKVRKISNILITERLSITQKIITQKNKIKTRK
jgi:hypothetical protein